MTGIVATAIDAVTTVSRVVSPTRATAGAVPAATAVTTVTRPSAGARPDFVSWGELNVEDEVRDWLHRNFIIIILLV